MEVQESTIKHTVVARPAVVSKGYSYSAPLSKTEQVLKRAFDIVFALGVLLFIFSWLFPLLCLLIVLDSRGGIFFVKIRNGLHNRVFRCYKFRTMVRNKEADLVAAGENDRRITRIGNFLRVSGLDELPQLFNVLKGDMSIVGPRPHMINDNLRFEKMAENYQFRTMVKPGITGLAQVKGYKGNANDDQSIRIRTILDLRYVRNQSFILDIKIIGETIKVMVVEIYKLSRRHDKTNG
jgi:putative colanic acid biosynthesis UDP-glucose lipid carrier transferase